MAAVFLAYDPALERQVAVKLLLPDVSIHVDVVERFLREARTVAALQHPHIVTVYGVRSRGDAHAIVMQFVDGTSLDTIVAEQGALPPARAARMLSQVAAGLQHAHDRGVVHRDVKPANVLVDNQGNAYVSDFGIARRNDAAIVTKTGLVLGSWDYMSPEQRAGERVTAAADQYAFGVMAFEVLSGRLPFPGTPAQAIRGHMETPAPSLRAVVPELTPAMDALIARMLAKDPAGRWPSLSEARQRLDELAEGRVSGAFAAVSSATSPVPVRYVVIGAVAVLVAVLVAVVAAWAIGLFGQSAPAALSGPSDSIARVNGPAVAPEGLAEPVIASGSLGPARGLATPAAGPVPAPPPVRTTLALPNTEAPSAPPLPAPSPATVAPASSAPAATTTATTATTAATSDAATTAGDLDRLRSPAATVAMRTNFAPFPGAVGPGLWVRGPREVYVGGQYGDIARFDGFGWAQISSGTPRHYVTAIHGTSGNGGCALAVTESHFNVPGATLWRGRGPAGCFAGSMLMPSAWP